MVEEIPITTAVDKEELLDIKVEAVKTPSPTQEFLQEGNPLEPGRDNTSYSRNSNKSSRAGSGLLNRIPSSKSRGSADSRENEMVLQPVQYKGSFLEMAQKLLEGTLVGQNDPAKSPAYSEYSHLTKEQEQASQLNVRARSLLWRVEALLSSPEQQFSNVVILDIPGSLETTATISSNIHLDICDFLNHGPKSITCKNIPLVVKVGKQAKVKFYHKIQALAFISKYKGCYKSLHHNMTLADHVEDPNEKQDISRMSFTKYLPDRIGMPRKPEVSSFLFSSITMETISSESVHAGQVTDPIKINFLSGSNSVTKNVIPLSLVQDPELQAKIGLRLDSGNLFLADKWIMNEESEAPKQFFDAMIEVFTEKLKQFNSESKFDEAVLVFKSWQDLGTFVNWAKLADYDRILQNYVSYFGVINSGEKADLRKVYQELTNAKIESELQCEEENLLIQAILGERIKRVRSFCQGFLEKNCVSTETLFTKIDDCDERVVEESNVCIVSLEFINDDENYFLTQIGTCIFNKTTAGKLNKKLNFSVVLPEGAMMDNNLVNFDLGIARNAESGQLEFFHEQQKKKYPVMSEKEALLSLFSFVSSNQGISGMQVSTTTLFTYSSYSSLPILLQAVKRNDLEKEFYQTFTSFTDFHMVASCTESSITTFKNGIPAISKLAEGLAGVKCSTTQHPANGMASLIYTLVEKLVKAGGQTADLRIITKSAKSSSCLKFSKKSILKHPLIAAKALKIFKGKKGEVAFDVLLRDVPSDPNELMLVKNPDVSKDVEILSNVASYEKVSLMLKNSSRSYFSLEKGALFGHLIPKPLAMEIPEVLPHLNGMPNLSKHSTAEAVLSEVEEPPPKPASSQKVKNPNTLQKPVDNKLRKQTEKAEESGSPSPGKTSFTKPINGFSFGKTKFDEGPHFQKTILSSLHMREFNLFAIAIECIELKNVQTLEPIKISLRSLHRSKDPVTIYIKPWDHSSYPEAHTLCTTCKTYGLHFADSCPAKGNCTACPGKHLRKDCPSKCCWNCLNSHKWKECTKPILTVMQKKLERLGFRFHNIDGKAVVKYCDVDNIEYNCYSKGSAMRRLMDSFDKSSTVLVGYNIAKILDLLNREAEKSNHNNILKRKIYAMIDVKWLFPEEYKEKPLKDLFKLCFKENCLSKTNTQAITEAIEQMISLRVDLGRFQTATSFVTDFGIRFNQKMLSALSVADYKASQVLFDLDPKLQSPRKEKNKEELTFASECYSKYISKPIMDMNPKFLSLEKVASARLISISIKTLVVSGKNQLLTLSLYDVKDDSLISCMAVVPAELSKMSPRENSYECRKCFSKPSFHFDKECPLLETCDLCLLVFELNHIKYDCQNNDMCWNCGQVHNWKKCSKLLLTLGQKQFQDFGLDFEVTNGKKKFLLQNGLEKIQCHRDVDVLEDLLKVLEVKDTVLIGYNITEILLDVFSSVLERPELRFRLQKNITGIVDIRWILGRMYRRSSLKSLVTQILGSAHDVDDSAGTAKQVAKIVRKVCYDETAMVMRRSCFSLTFTPSLLLELLSQDINMDSDMFRSYKESTQVKHEVLEEESNELLEDTNTDLSLDEEIPKERLEDDSINEVFTGELVKEDENGASKQVEEVDELVVFIHLVVKSSEEIEVLEQIDVLIVNGENKQRYSQMFGRGTQNLDQAAFFFSQLEKGLASPAAKSITGVFLCPESFRIFGALLESNTGSNVKAIFTSWVSLVGELSSSSTVMTGISYQPGKLSTLYLDTFGENLNPSKNVCEALNEIYKELGMRKDKNKMVKAVTLDNLVKEECCIVLVHISVNWDAETVTDSGVPQIESLAYQDLSNEEIVEHKALVYSGRTLWQEWRLKFEHKRVVLMSLQNDSTIPLLIANLMEHGGASKEELECLVFGVCDFRSFMTKMGEEDFFSSFQSLETMQSSALLQLVTRILLGALGSSVNYDNFLISFGHGLDSPYFNKQLLNSKLPIFSENLVSLVITKSCVVAPEDINTATVKVVSPRRIPRGCLVKILSSSLPFLELEVENLLNVSEEFTVEVEMLNVEFEDVTIPENTEIAKGELVLNEDGVNEFKQKISVRTDLLTSAIEINPELEESAGPLQQTKAQTHHHCAEQEEEEEEDSSLLDEMTDNLLVTRLGFFRMDQ